ncbi:MAG: Ig-like domain-containing protein [Calditrichaeota bacterium]|nr:Ig-like domain-containing protein [Calditrichota bacterium]
MKHCRTTVIVVAALLSGCSLVEKLANRPPVIVRVYALDNDLYPGDTTTVIVEAEDPDGDLLSYQWNTTGGAFVGSAQGARALWQAPTQPGSYQLTVTVRDENGAQVTGSLTVVVASEEPPQVTIVRPREGEALPGLGTFRVEARVTHPTSPIERVEFCVDGTLLFTDTAAEGNLYAFLWNLDGLSGPKTVVAKGYRLHPPGPPGADSVHVVIEGVTPFPR